MNKEVDEKRDKTPKRKLMHKNVDKNRDKTPKRKLIHKKVDKKRNRRPDRKTFLQKYEQTETRRHYTSLKNKGKYQKQLELTLLTDTGFDVICASCLQYKSKSFCKLVTDDIKRKYKNFIVKSSSFLKNRNNGKFLCNICFRDIKLIFTFFSLFS